MPYVLGRSKLPLVLAALLAGLPAAALFPGAARAQDADASDTAPPPAPDDADEGGPPPAEALPPAQVPAPGGFDQALAGYGHWAETPDYGRVWIPDAASHADWQPYTNGSWVYTDAGWAFASDVPWGWAVFHYGRWGWREGPGWFWVPGYIWAPAWVSWRHSQGHVAWSPYGPRGFNYGPRWHGWVAVEAQHFTHPIGREMIPRAHVGPIVRGARPAPSIRSAPEHGRAYGPPRGVTGAGRGGRGGSGARGGAGSRGGGARSAGDHGGGHGH